MQTLTLTRPDDWHLHLRDGAALATVVPHTARQFARAIVMPNLTPPVTTTVPLAEGTIAMIDARGKIYVGKRFLQTYADQLDVQVGVLAHEIGHRPKRWADYRATAPKSKDELERLCRTEETYADYFCGRALAELGMGVEPVCQFLLAVAEQPHPEYFPAALRVEVIKDGYADGRRKSELRKKMFPELAKRVSAKDDLGTG